MGAAYSLGVALKETAVHTVSRISMSFASTDVSRSSRGRSKSNAGVAGAARSGRPRSNSEGGRARPATAMVSQIGVEIVRSNSPDRAPVSSTSGAPVTSTSGAPSAEPSGSEELAVDAREVPSANPDVDDDLNPDARPAARHRVTCACDQPSNRDGGPTVGAPGAAPAAAAPAETQLETVTLEDIGPGFGSGGAPVLLVSDVAVRHAHSRSKRRFGSPAQVLCSRFVLIQVRLHARE